MNLVVGTAGHIDHGKSALLRALTGVQTDRLLEEKRRGITIDLGFAALKLGTRDVAFVDVPGHERFVRNMLAGATGIDAVLFVVAADDSVMPQTREHLEILRLLELGAGLVVVTKCDLAEPSWLDMVEDDVRSLVAGTFLEGAPILRVSATTGQGIDELRTDLAKLCDRAPSRPDVGPFRMAIDRSFSLPGYGTVVSGTIASGSVSSGDELEWWPAGKLVRVRGLHRHDRAEDRLSRGARAAINLAGVHHNDVKRGDELATPGYLAATRLISVEVRGSTGARRPLRHRGRYRLHLGTAEVTATLALLGDFDGDAPALAQLLIDEPVVAVHGEPFVLREESPASTLGGGRVLQPVAQRTRRRDAEAIERLSGLRSPEPAHRVGTALGFAGLDPWTDLTLCRDSGVPLPEVPGYLDAMKTTGRTVAVATGSRRSATVPTEVAADLEARLLRALSRLHEAHPRQSSIGRARVAAALEYLDNAPLVGGLIDGLRVRGLVVADARTVALKGFEPKLSQGERKLKAEIADAYRLGGMSPPEPSTWMAKTNPRASVVPELLTLLCEEERLVPIGPDLYLDADAEAAMRRTVAKHLANGSTLTMAGLRDILGTSRKYAIPIGEYLDRIGLTERDGDIRRLRQPVVMVGEATP